MRPGAPATDVGLTCPLTPALSLSAHVRSFVIMSSGYPGTGKQQPVFNQSPDWWWLWSGEGVGQSSKGAVNCSVVQKGL